MRDSANCPKVTERVRAGAVPSSAVNPHVFSHQPGHFGSGRAKSPWLCLSLEPWPRGCHWMPSVPAGLGAARLLPVLQVRWEGARGSRRHPRAFGERRARGSGVAAAGPRGGTAAGGAGALIRPCPRGVPGAAGSAGCGTGPLRAPSARRLRERRRTCSWQARPGEMQ